MLKATFQFQDGGELAVEVAPGQTVLEAAIAGDAPVRHDCCSGSCGTCIAEHVSGQARVDADRATVPLTADELAAGLLPTCLASLESDATFRVPYPLHPAAPAPARHTARLVSLTAASPSVHRLLLEVEGPGIFDFQPGQYVRIRAPGLKAVRAYSIASTEADLPRLELLIRHVPDGAMSGWLRDKAQPGDRLVLHGPLGAFALQNMAPAHLFVAGGTGLAPVLSMVRAMGSGPALLCFGCSRPQDLFYLAELRDLAAARPQLTVRVALGDSGGAPLPAGVTLGNALSLLSPADLVPGMVAYLCGPPGMVQAARAYLLANGLSPMEIRAERFLPS